MTTLRLYFDNERVGPRLDRATKRAGARVRAASRQTAKQAADEVVTRGRADIEGAPGNWGARWSTGLKAQVTEGGGSIRIAISHDEPYFNVFEHGAVIHGKPLLWIPLSAEYGGSADAQGVYARDYSKPLFRVDRAGKAPLLMTWPGKKYGPRRGLRDSKSSTPAKPVYFGKESVTIPQKFHVREIAREVAREMPQMYRQNLKKEQG